MNLSFALSKNRTGANREYRGDWVFMSEGTAKVRFFKILRDFDCLDIHEAKDVADGILHGTVVEGSPAVLYGNGIATVVRPWEGIVVFQYFPDGEGAVFRRVFLNEGAAGRTGINGYVLFPQCVESGAQQPV